MSFRKRGISPLLLLRERRLSGIMSSVNTFQELALLDEDGLQPFSVITRKHSCK